MSYVTRTFHSDAGHGWLAVKKKELILLGIAEKITSCSYQKGLTAYLEEDCDAGTYLKEMSRRGVTVHTKEGRHYERCCLPQ